MLIASRAKVFIASVHFRGILALVNNSLSCRPFSCCHAHRLDTRYWQQWLTCAVSWKCICKTPVVSVAVHVSTSVSETLTFVWNATAGADNWMKTLAENFVCKTNHWNGKTASLPMFTFEKPQRKVNTKRKKKSELSGKGGWGQTI